MPSKLQTYSQMADEAARQITDSHTEWTAFLRTAGQLYKYPYNEQLMIYAQRPDATACAEFDFWNNAMRRYVRRGSKGIALVDTTAEIPKIRYVFDVSDTGSRENSRSVNLWELKSEYFDTVSAMLERNYDISGAVGLADRIEHVAAQLADEYWNDHRIDACDTVDNSFLEEYDDFNIGVQFRSAATVSITYALMSRCGLEPEDYLEHEDFLSVFDFNTPETVAALGTAVSEISQQVLRQIEITVKNYERTHENERDTLHEERRLPDTRPDVIGAVGESLTESDDSGQIRATEESVPEGTPPDTLESADTVGEALPAPVGDRGNGESTLRADDAGADEIGGSNGEPESVRPAEWVGLMNNCKVQAEETILAELIYS